jgi:hypothetical protein
MARPPSAKYAYGPAYVWDARLDAADLGVAGLGTRPSGLPKGDGGLGFPTRDRCLWPAPGAARGRADGVELSFNSLHLVPQFWSPSVNQRQDEHGGSLENRTRRL